MNFHKTTASNGQEGFVLVSVIWIVLLIAVLSSAFAINTRLNVKASANLAYAAGTQQISDGVVRLLALEVAVMLAEPVNMTLNGGMKECSLPGRYTARYAMQDQSGLIDLNAASKRLLERFFTQITGDQNRDSALSDAILDFRDVDDQRRSAGAERADYRSAGRRHGPKNAPFQAVEELDQVLGMDETAYHAAKHFLTIHSRRDGIAVNHAPAALLELLKVSGGDGAASGLVRRENQASGRVGISVAVQRGGTRNWSTRYAAIALLRRPRQPFAILEWSTHVAPGIVRSGDADAAALPPCPFNWPDAAIQ